MYTCTIAPLATALIFMVTVAVCHDAEGLVKLSLLDVVLNNVESISNFSDAGLAPTLPFNAIEKDSATASMKEMPFVCPTVAPIPPAAPGSSNELLVVTLIVLLGLLTQSNTKAHQLKKSSGGAAQEQEQQKEKLQEQLHKVTDRVSELTEASSKMRAERTELQQQLRTKRTELSVASHKLSETRRALNVSREVAVQLQSRILEESSKGQERQLVTSDLRERVEQLELMLETSEEMSADQADQKAEAEGDTVAAVIVSELAVLERECEQQSHQIDVLTSLLKTQVEMNQMYTADMACVEQSAAPSTADHWNCTSAPATADHLDPYNLCVEPAQEPEEYHLWTADSFNFDNHDMDVHNLWGSHLTAFASTADPSYCEQ